MAVSKTGTFFEDFVTGFFVYGDGANGDLTIDSGSVYTLDASNATDEPEVRIGRNGGTGTVTVTGAGSTLELDANGDPNQSAGIVVGQGAGSVGTLNVLAGGLLSIVDSLGTASTDQFERETLRIGVDGATGSLNVNAGTVEIKGSGTSFDIGSNGATADALFANGSTLTIETLTSDTDHRAGLVVGRDSGTVSTLTFDNSSGTISAAGDSETFFNIGEDGATGTMTLQNGASFLVLETGNAMFHGIDIGRNVGTNGTVNVINSTLTVDSSTASNTENFFQVGRDGTGTLNIDNGTVTSSAAEDSFMNIGEGATGNGTISVINGGQVSLSAGTGKAGFNVGRQGGTGQAAFSASTLSITAAQDAFIDVGEGAGTGSLVIDSASTLNMSGGTRVNLNIGVDFNSDGPGNGTFDLLGGSTINLSGAAGASFGSSLGEAGTGIFNINASTLVASMDEEFYMGIGRNGGSGTLNVLNSSTVSLTSANAQFAGLQVGRDDANSTGTINITDSSMILTNNGQTTYFDLGRDNGTGTLNLDNGTFQSNGNIEAGIQAGRDGGTADIDLINGSLLEFNSDSRSGFTLGRNGGTATLDVDASTVRFMSTGTGLFPGETGPKEAGGSIGRDGGSAVVNFTNGSLFDINAAADAYINIGRSGAGSSSLNLTDSTLNIESSSATNGAFLNVGRDGSTGTLNADDSTINVMSTAGFAGLRVGRDSGTPGATGSVVLDAETSVTITGAQAQLSVGHTANASGDLQVLLGSTIYVSHTSGVLYDSSFNVGVNQGTTSATVLIDGSPSRIYGMDAVNIGYNPYQSGAGPDIGNGQVTITGGGLLSGGYVTVGRGGSLILGDSSVVITDPTSFLAVNDGSLTVLAGATASVTGQVALDVGASATIQVAADGSSAGMLAHNGTNFFVNASATVTIEALGGYQYQQGDTYTIFTTTGIYDSDLPASGEIVTGQSADFGFAFGRENSGGTRSIDFIALNNGDGSGSALLDFDSLSSVAAEFTYDSAAAYGEGFGGKFQAIGAHNVDEIAGTSAGDIFTTTGPGSIILHGNGGDDTLTGAAGSDLLLGGAGADALDGGGGIDTASYNDASKRVIVDLQNSAINFGDAVGDTFTNIEMFEASRFGDQLRGDSGDNNFFGGNSSDRLYGRAGDDILNGGLGVDAIYGNAGVDTMTGGDGTARDRFIYFNINDTGIGGNNRDIITDFGNGPDRIEISRFDADTNTGGNQVFNFIGTTGFSGTAGELRYFQSGGVRTVVQGDVDGDGVRDFEIELTGLLTLSAGDFLL